MPTEEVPAVIRATRNRDELLGIQQFKYGVYVKEMERYRDIADHENQKLAEEDDPTSHNILIEVDGELVGTARLTWGGDDGAIRKRHIEQYDLELFLASMPMDQIVICERVMIKPRFRGTTLLMQLFSVMMKFVNERRIQLFIGDCEPHLINTYEALGFRTYTERNVNSPTTGFLIPLLIVTEDVEYLRRIGSPLAGALREYADDARVPDRIDELIERGAAVQSERMSTTATYMKKIAAAAEQAGALQSGLFAHLSEAEIVACISKSVLISCNQGDRIIKQGNVAKNMNLVLSGEFEIRSGGKTIADIGAGEVFGEIAFFLKQPRTADVVAKIGGSRIISFNDRTVRELIQDDSEIAAKLLRNISTMLCRRLSDMNKQI